MTFQLLSLCANRLWAHYLDFLFAFQFSLSLHVIALCDFDSHPRIPIFIRARPDVVSFNLIFECFVNITCCVIYFLHIAYSWAFLQWDRSLALTLMHCSLIILFHFNYSITLNPHLKNVPPLLWCVKFWYHIWDVQVNVTTLISEQYRQDER